jgi:polyphosphate glucokinase
MAHAQSSAEVPSLGRTRTLAIDVGGTGLKASIVDESGRLLTDRARVDTPVGAPPKEIVQALVQLVQPLGTYDRVSVGFPGVVREGRVLTAPNLGNKGWKGYDLAGALAKALGKPVRVANDADVQGLAVIAGKGVEVVITLGTGFGTGLYLDGRLGPHLELSHHPFRKGETYDEQLGNAARKDVGKKKWNKRVRKAIDNLRTLTNFDHLYIGGGNAKKIDFELDPDVTIVDNAAGLAGGVVLWRD